MYTLINHTHKFKGWVWIDVGMLWKLFHPSISMKMLYQSSSKNEIKTFSLTKSCSLTIFVSASYCWKLTPNFAHREGSRRLCLSTYQDWQKHVPVLFWKETSVEHLYLLDPCFAHSLLMTADTFISVAFCLHCGTYHWKHSHLKPIRWCWLSISQLKR